MASGEKNKKWLGYTLYVVLVTVILLYFLFPAQAVEEFMDSSVSRINPEFVFKAEKLRPWIPAGIRITAGQFYLSGTENENSIKVPAFRADSLYIGPQILKLARGEYSFDIAGKAYRGDINGTLRLTGKNRELFAGEMTFRDFALADYNFLTEKFKHRVIGNLSGEIIYGNESAGTAGGSGRVKLRLSDGQLQFQVPVFNMSSLDLQSIELEAKLVGRREITITRAELEGPEVKGTLTGSIRLHNDVGLSQLNLKGTLEPLAEFYKNYPEVRELLKAMKKRVKRGQYFFTVTGTLGQPEFKLL